MSVSTSLLAYQDCITIMDQALADPKGARIKVANAGDASYQRLRMHYARKLHRDENAKTYEQGHAMHGRSEYDAITVRIRNIGGECYLYLERTDVVAGEVESLSELEPLQIEHEPQRQIEPPRAIVDGQAMARVIETVVRRRV